MLKRNSQGHIQCPPLVAGQTPEDLLAWYSAKVGSQYDTLAAEYGPDAMLDLAVMAYSQERFLALVTDTQPPETDDERELVQAVVGGAPFSLTPVGLAAADEAAGLYPWLEYGTQGWRWHLNDVHSKPFANPMQALRSYEAFARAVLTAV